MSEELRVSLAMLAERALLLSGSSTGTVADEDTIIYEAQRDFIAPLDRGDGGLWRFDRVTWRGRELPSGELLRSIGHTNPDSQLEEFICVDGLAYVAVGFPGDAAMTLVRLEPGGVLRLPGGAWHLTFASGPHTTVENRYTAGAAPVHGKYDASKAPVFPVTLARHPDQGLVAVNLGARQVTIRGCGPAESADARAGIWDVAWHEGGMATGDFKVHWTLEIAAGAQRRLPWEADGDGSG